MSHVGSNPTLKHFFTPSKRPNKAKKNMPKEIAWMILELRERLDEYRRDYPIVCKKFGKNFRQLRQKADLSLSEVARRCEVSKAFLSDVELGRRAPNDAILKIEFEGD